MTDHPTAIPPDSDPSDCDEEALNWFVHFSDAPHTAHTDAAFQRWLAGRPDRQAAYARWQADWRQMQAFPLVGVERLHRRPASDSGAAARQPSAPQSRAGGWKGRVPHAVLAALILLLCASGGYIAWRHW
jgi:transmembrane sensor